MQVSNILADKQLKAKEKVQLLSQYILAHTTGLDEVIHIASTAKEADKANCIEAIEFATRANVSIGSLACLELVTQALLHKAPRIKWESAKVVGNIAALFPSHLEDAIHHLLLNSEHSGTVVRWSAAFALGEIVQLKTHFNEDLIPAIEAITKREEKKSIQKIYSAALKKVRE